MVFVNELYRFTKGRHTIFTLNYFSKIFVSINRAIQNESVDLSENLY